MLLGAATIVSCNKFDLNYDEAERTKQAQEAQDIKDNAKKILGDIDPNQNWNSINSATITVTADANLHDIAKVQILTESPIMNDDSKVLAEADVQKGQTVELSYDAPSHYQRLIAACIDSKGRYYLQGFETGTASVSFQNGNVVRSARRANAADYPDSKFFKLDPLYMTNTYNALRTTYVTHAYNTHNTTNLNIVSKANLSKWNNSGWEQDRLWVPTNNNSTGTTWVINNQIKREVDDFTEQEKTDLQDIFGDFLVSGDQSETWGRKDNRKMVMASKTFQFYNNQLTSDGETPITVTPVFMPSSENGSCHLYYYYYNPNDVPLGMSEADYIKTLPKFKGLELWTAKSQQNERYNNGELIKTCEFLLPFYGEPADLTAKPLHANTFGTFSNKIYRIRNGRALDGEDYYMIYNPSVSNDMINERAFINDSHTKLATKYADDAVNIDYQLWQIFTTNTGKKLLYNLGGKVFFVIHDKSRWESSFSNILSVVQDSYLDFEEAGGDNTYYFKRAGEQKGLGSDLGIKGNKSIFTDKTSSTGDNFKWILEEYTGNGASSPVDDAILDDLTAATNATPALAIPKGYRIGFMLRKMKNTSTYIDGLRAITDCGHGCCYGYGNLNTEINTLVGHFESSVSKFSMEAEDPRCCYIQANGKTYIGFEDGCDCTFNDFILEVGGYDQTMLTEAPANTEEKGSGIETEDIYNDNEIEGIAYTMCFEDRPKTADYDLNDVVLRCSRKDKTTLILSLVATGALDNVRIMGAEGWKYNGKEVHELFGAVDSEGNNHFVNTEKGGNVKDAISAEVTVSENLSIPDYLKNISIINMSTERSIELPKKTGEPPYAIIVPGIFEYPLERVCINDAYLKFKNWAQDMTTHTDWYTEPESEKVYE